MVPTVGIEEFDGDAIVRVHVQPRAGRTAVAGAHGDALRVRVQAPPVDGRATEAARDVVAEAFGIPAARVELLSGERSRLKRFRLRGVSRSAAEATVRGLLGPPAG